MNGSRKALTDNGPARTTVESTRSLNARTLLWPVVLAALAAMKISAVSAPATMVLLCYWPGRLVVRAAGLGAGWDAAGRFILYLAFSLCLAPVLLDLPWHVTNEGRLIVGPVGLLVVAGTCAVERWCSKRPDDASLRLFEGRRSRWAAAGFVVVLAVATIGPYWPTEVHGAPLPAIIHDFVKHHAVFFSLERSPLPLGNPFYAAETHGPVYYYHYFYLIPATVRALAPALSAELAFGLHGLLVAVAATGMVYLMSKRLTGADGPALLSAALLTVAGGLDILPVLLLHKPTIFLDAWADHVVRIAGMLTQMQWSPQNVLGVLVGLVAAYVLSLKGWWRGWLLLGPPLAAALVGASVWPAMPLVLAAVVLVLMDAGTADGRGVVARRLLGAVSAGALMTLAVAPALRHYAEMSARHGKSLTAQWPHQWNALLGRLAPPGILANLLDLPWVLAIEAGGALLFLLLLPRSRWRRAWRDPGVRWLLLASLAAVAGFVSLRSHFRYNDFGQKTMMVALTTGAILAGGVLDPAGTRSLGLRVTGRSPRRRLGKAAFIWAVLALGSPILLYQTPLSVLRRYILPGSRLAVLVHPTVVLAAEEARAYRFLRYELPPDAVLQAHWGAERVDLVQISRKQYGVAVLQEDTMVFQPVDRAAHAAALATLANLLDGPGDARLLHARLRSVGATHVFVGRIERRVWKDLSRFDSPEWFEPVFRDGDTAVYRLRSSP